MITENDVLHLKISRIIEITQWSNTDDIIALLTRSGIISRKGTTKGQPLYDVNNTYYEYRNGILSRDIPEKSVIYLHEYTEWLSKSMN